MFKFQLTCWLLSRWILWQQLQSIQVSWPSISCGYLTAPLLVSTRCISLKSMRQQESNQHHSSMLCITVYSTTVVVFLSLPSYCLDSNLLHHPTDLRVSTILVRTALTDPSSADVPVNKHDVIVSNMISPVIWSVLLEMMWQRCYNCFICKSIVRSITNPRSYNMCFLYTYPTICERG
jgi:hypothetical protein